MASSRRAEPYAVPTMSAAIGPDATLVQLRAAARGDDPSVAWLVERFTPLLLAQARTRLGAELRRVIDPEDLVQEVWAIALPKLAAFADRDDLGAGALVAFLARILLYRCNDLVRKHIVGKPRRADATAAALSRLPAQHSGAVTRAVRGETRSRVRDALAVLSDDDRQIVVLRGLEQHGVGEIAALLGLSENLVSVRYRRALQRLREALPGDVFDVLPEA